MSAIVGTIGIILSVIGTIWTLWSILGTSAKYIGTYDEMENRQNDFRKTKKQVIIGCVGIFFGGILQIISLFL